MTTTAAAALLAIHHDYLSLRTSLEQYHATDQMQAIYKKEILDFLSRYQYDAFKRETLIGHITGSAFLLNNDGSRFLLMHHKKLDRWMQPGGHCDGVANVLAVAIREAEEESGISGIVPVRGQTIFDIDIHAIPERGSEPSHLHFDIRYLLRTTTSNTLIQNGESHALEWFAWDATALPTSERSVLRMVEKYRTLQRNND